MHNVRQGIRSLGFILVPLLVTAAITLFVQNPTPSRAFGVFLGLFVMYAYLDRR